MTELTYTDAAAARYEQGMAHVTMHFVPFLLGAGQLAPGQRVLDIATGTGLAAEAALSVVGPGGHVTAADVSAAMVARARCRLAGAVNVVVGVEDGQALSYPDASFDAVICSLGLMFFPNPARGLAEFHRVLRPGGRAAVAVMTTPERSYNGRINMVIARYVPSLVAATARTFSLAEAAKLRSMFADAGFADIETTTERHEFILPTFDAYYGPFEAGGGSTGAALLSLNDTERQAVRGEMQRSLGDTGGPVTIAVEYRFASGRK